MAAASNSDYIANRPTARSRPSATALGTSPRSPRTPQLGRSISSQFGSPGAFREQEDVVIYELNVRYFSAGFAGESRPRCILPFTPDAARRAGDFRQYDPEYAKTTRHFELNREWGDGYELYKTNLQELDLGLVQDKLDRALRIAMVDFLQFDAKGRKAVLTVPPLLPTALLELTLEVLFSHFSQPVSISLLTTPVLSCVSAGLRNALVVDIGWEETIVTAVGEYKEVAEKRSVRAGSLLTREMRNMLEQALGENESTARSNIRVTFAEAEDITQRLAWCGKREQGNTEDLEKSVQLPIPGRDAGQQFSLRFEKFAQAAERALFASADYSDDHEAPLHLLAYRVLLSLPTDLRALCVSRIVVTGSHSSIPGLKGRLLQEISHLITTRGWDPVSTYGSARLRSTQALKERSINIALRPAPSVKTTDVSLSPLNRPLQDGVPHAERVHDDIQNDITLKIEREAAKGKTEPVSRVVRGVNTLGPWAGASLLATMRVKGAYEIEREEFLKHGLRGNAVDI